MINPETIEPQSLPYISLPKRNRLPEISCIYFVMADQGVIQYIGRTNNLRKR